MCFSSPISASFPLQMGLARLCHLDIRHGHRSCSGQWNMSEKWCVLLRGRIVWGLLQDSPSFIPWAQQSATFQMVVLSLACCPNQGQHGAEPPADSWWTWTQMRNKPLLFEATVIWSLLAITTKLAYTTAIECLCDFGEATDMLHPSVFSPVSFQKMAPCSSS